MMVIDPDIMPDNTAFILDLAYIQPVFTNIPGYGTVFVRDIDQDANARIGKAIYMEMGFGVRTSFISLQDSSSIVI